MKRSELKRKTPMPRGTSQLKRTGRLRAKSKTNSRNNRDESVIREYRQSHASCALCGAPTEEIHHIFGGRTRHHIWANLISLCVRFGHGCHTPSIHTPAGKIRCLWWKLKHGELDVAALDAMGSERLAGWLSRQRLSGSDERKRLELLKFVERSEMRGDHFTVTEQHLKLLRRMNVGWCGDEFGAPEIDPKRPYGNSSVIDDIHEILTGNRWNEDRDGPMPGGMADAYEKLHMSTKTALQIVLCRGEFAEGEFYEKRYGEWLPVPF